MGQTWISDLTITFIAAGTEMLMEAFSHVVIARIATPVAAGHHFKDHITRLIKSAKVAPIPTSATILPDIIPALVTCLAEKKAGFLNAVNPGLIDDEELVRIYQSVEQSADSYSVICDQEELQAIAAQSPKSFLESGKLERWISELPAEVKQKYGVPEKLRETKERVAEILDARKGTLQMQYVDVNEYENIVYSGPDAPTLEHQMRKKQQRAGLDDAARKKGQEEEVTPKLAGG